MCFFFFSFLYLVVDKNVLTTVVKIYTFAKERKRRGSTNEKGLVLAYQDVVLGAVLLIVFHFTASGWGCERLPCQCL